MLSRRPAWGDKRLGKVAREGQVYPCYQHDMMMMIIYMCIFLLKISKLEELSDSQRVGIYIYTPLPMREQDVIQNHFLNGV